MKSPIDIRCSRKFVGRRGITRPCNRKPLWRISYLGGFCNFHFEDYLTTHNVDPEDITRLSDDEKDFVVKAEPGKGYSSSNSNGGSKRETHTEAVG